MNARGVCEKMPRAAVERCASANRILPIDVTISLAPRTLAHARGLTKSDANAGTETLTRLTAIDVPECLWLECGSTVVDKRNECQRC